uniref:Uncharacterized protein n=1 Tax=Rhizophagus irregularis (strain DAOM 181602 / DAOM 197198 / MUCL 43194) TaxID=747089 RepID=U9T5J3_RHIID
MKYYMGEGIPMEMIVLLLRKGVFPYEYIDSHKKFKETSIPPIEKFHGVLKGKITQKDYKHAEKLRVCSIPILGCDVKIHRSENRTFTDMEMHDFAERARRDGITMTCRRYFKANNPNAKTMTCAVQKHSCHTLMQIIFMDGLHSSHIVPLGVRKVLGHIAWLLEEVQKLTQLLTDGPISELKEAIKAKKAPEFDNEQAQAMEGGNSWRSRRSFEEKLALLQALLNKSVHAVDVVVSPKRTKSFKWTVNIEHATLDGIKEWPQRTHIVHGVHKTPAKRWSGT